jgi:VIT1/CCC1 family predicted Fe2+/Mn2+ transporter
MRADKGAVIIITAAIGKSRAPAFGADATFLQDPTPSMRSGWVQLGDEEVRPMIEQVEAVRNVAERHLEVGGNTLRAAVLGANDGLTSNLALVMGVAGASLSARSVLLTGLAGLLAGAWSMAIGEWISVQSARELYERQADAKSAHDATAREELGLDADQLAGSPYSAAASSFVLFALGAVVPLLPYLAGATGWPAAVVALVCAALAMFKIGSLITLLTHRSALFSGGRQVVFGLAASGITFGLGRLIGMAVGT